MNIQTKILLAFVVWLGGVILDTQLVPFAFILIYAGTAWMFFETGKWLKAKENRARVIEALPFGWKGGVVESINRFFDLSWRRISVLWTGIGVFAMIFTIFLGTFKLFDAYDVAITSIENDKEIIRRTGRIIHYAAMVRGNVNSLGKSVFDVGVIGKEESFWVVATVERDGDTYRTTALEIR